MKQYFTLSEAIRDGAKLKPQGFGRLFDGERTCSLGAAYDALGALERASFTIFDLAQLYPYIDNNVSRPCGCPDRLVQTFPVFSTMTHLNDVHHWTRERIASWLERYEESIGYVTITEQVESDQHAAAGVTEYVTV